MKILFDHRTPVFLAHGGFGLRTQQTRKALIDIGVDVEFVRWWDDNQTGDLIHFFGKPSINYIYYAHLKGIKIVSNELHSGLGSRPRWKHILQGAVIGATKKLYPPAATRMGWTTYEHVDAMIAQTQFEADLMCQVFHAPRETMHVIPGGVNDEFFAARRDPSKREDWLISTVSITTRKRPAELAEAAGIAKVPIRFCGRPYSEKDEYFKRFMRAVEKYSAYVKYEGDFSDRAALAEMYGRARGFVLPSTQETLSLSSLEAAAAGCPLWLTNLPWATTTFGDKATYCPDTGNPEILAESLRKFYDNIDKAPRDFPVLSWKGVAERLRDLYAELLNKPTQ
jgi:Glycosyltransferase